jgi:hypothetical protein
MKLLLFGDIEGTRPIQLLLLREPDGTSAASLGSYCGGPDLGPALFETPSGAGNQRGSSSDQTRPVDVRAGFDPGRHATRPPKAGLAGVVPACIVRSRLVIKCDHCGKPAVPVHMPQVNASIYCKDCCPVCSPQSGVRAQAQLRATN